MQWIRYGTVYISAACLITGYLWTRRADPSTVRAEDLAELRAALVERDIAYLTGDETYTNAATLGWGDATTNTPPQAIRIDYAPTLDAAYTLTFKPIRDRFLAQTGPVYWLLGDIADGDILQYNTHAWTLSRTNDFGAVYAVTNGARRAWKTVTADTAASPLIGSGLAPATDFAAFGQFPMSWGTNAWIIAAKPAPTHWKRLCSTNLWTLPSETASNNAIVSVSRAISTNDLNACRAALTNMTRAVRFGDTAVSCTNTFISSAQGILYTNCTDTFDTLIPLSWTAPDAEQSTTNLPDAQSGTPFVRYELTGSRGTDSGGWASLHLYKTVCKRDYTLAWPCAQAYASGLVRRVRVYAVFRYLYDPAAATWEQDGNTYVYKNNSPNFLIDGVLAFHLSALPFFTGGSSLRATFDSSQACQTYYATLLCDVSSPTVPPSFSIDATTFAPDPSRYTSVTETIPADSRTVEYLHGEAAIDNILFITVADLAFSHCAATPFSPTPHTPAWATNSLPEAPHD